MLATDSQSWADLAIGQPGARGHLLSILWA